MRLAAPVLGLAVVLTLLVPAGAQAAGEVLQLNVEGPITKGTALYVDEGLAQAERAGAVAVVLRLNTPGGGLQETFEITDRIASSPVPVIGFVAPRTANAWSAGTVILMSTHVAAMAPFTVIGSSQPVELGSGGFTPINDSKVINAIVAKLQALAAAHGRNQTAAKAFVTENLNLNADQALAANVIEVQAADAAALLQAVDGRTVGLAAGNVTLHTRDAPLRIVEPGLRVTLLQVLFDPIIAGLLMLVGVYALIFGLGSPGLGAEVAGAILILLGLVGLGFNVSYIGLGLIVLGAALLLIEVHAGHGVFGIAGVAVLVLGTIFLAPLNPAGPAQWSFPASYQQQVLLILATPSLFLAAFLAFALYKVREVRRQTPFNHGPEGHAAEVTDALGPGKPGFVRYRGESWQAISEWDLQPGDRVRIRGKDGPVLRVEPEGPRERAESGKASGSHPR